MRKNLALKETQKSYNAYHSAVKPGWRSARGKPYECLGKPELDTDKLEMEGRAGINAYSKRMKKKNIAEGKRTCGRNQ